MVYIKLVIFISYGFVLIYDDTLKLFFEFSFSVITISFI